MTTITIQYSYVYVIISSMIMTIIARNARPRGKAHIMIPIWALHRGLASGPCVAYHNSNHSNSTNNNNTNTYNA